MDANKLVGHWTCPDCGEQCEVGQAARRGNHFYTDCGQDRCGINQGTGAGRQNRIWREAVFLSGATVKRPNNVTETGDRPPVNEPLPSTDRLTDGRPDDGDTVDDFDPDSIDDEPQEETGNRSALIGAGVAALAILGGLLLP